MYSFVDNNIYRQEISTKDFQRISQFIYSFCGITFPLEKKSLLEGRLRKRIKTLNFENFESYIDFVFSNEGSKELVNMIDVVTTNKTDFFREQLHFDYLRDKILTDDQFFSETNNINIWSAGCSTGEEPYTLFMVVNEALQNSNYSFKIIASDISTEVLKIAQQGVYEAEKTNVIPYSLKKQYFLRGKNEYSDYFKINNEVTKKIDFFRFNLLESAYNPQNKQDVIFCRNVIIYFDKITQLKVLKNFAVQLNPGGYLFLGHSETITGLDVPFERIASTIYKRI